MAHRRHAAPDALVPQATRLAKPVAPPYAATVFWAGE